MELTLTSIIVRISVMYLAALALVRLAGKQSIGELATMDFVVVTILGDGLDSVIYGEVPVMDGVIYLATIVFLHLLVSYVSSRSKLAFRVFNSPARLMIQHGMVQHSGLAAERMRPEEVASHMRERGEDLLHEVKEAWLESNGRLSVVRTTASRPVQKQDLRLLK
jgi:uncharacterized membrane protein YcaP (DUF421 family)